MIGVPMRALAFTRLAPIRPVEGCEGGATRACRSGPVSFDVCLKAGDHGHPKAARPANPQSFEIRNEKESNMTTETNGAGWTTAAVLVGRLIFAALFIMAVSFKLMDINATAAALATAGFPPPPVFALGAAGVAVPLLLWFLPPGAFFGGAPLGAAPFAVFSLRVPRAP